MPVSINRKTATSIFVAAILILSVFYLVTESGLLDRDLPGGSVVEHSPDSDHALRLPVQTGAHKVIAPGLDIPTVVSRPNASSLRPYFALRSGLEVKYIGNMFSQNQPDLIWVPHLENGKERLVWSTHADGEGGLVGLFEGDVVTLVDDVIYDLDVGTLFVKVKKGDFPVGYMLLETLIGETEVQNDALIVATDPARFRKFSSVLFDRALLFEQTVTNDYAELRNNIGRLLDDQSYDQTLNGGVAGGVHPLFAMSTARTMLFTALQEETPEDLRNETIASVAHFFEEYVLKEKVSLGEGMISWPYNFEWNLNWGIKLSPPWYSPFANSQVVVVSAIMYKLTGLDKYKKIAYEAALFITTPISEGGSEYKIDGFRLPAEYVYPTPPLPNVRVLDGELGVAISLYNAARILGDSNMLSDATAYFASIAMNLEGYITEDGDLSFAHYFEKMPDGYRWPMWTLLQNAAMITKDRRFSVYATTQTEFIGEIYCKEYGC